MKRGSLLLLCLAAASLGFFTARTLSARDEKAAAAARVREEFELMKLFAEAYGQVDLQYVRDVDRRKLIDNAIRGMLTGLDPWSSWIPPQDLARFEQYIDQEFVGIGLQMVPNPARAEIQSVLPESPAARAGVRAGDLLVEVDSRPVTGLSPPEINRLMTGPEGRSVTITLRRTGEEQPLKLEITRERIQLPTVIPAIRNPDGSPQWLVDPAHRIACIRITHFSRSTIDDLRRTLETVAGLNPAALLIDLRSNPGGLMDAAIEICDMFLESGRIVSMQGRAVRERVWDAAEGTAIANSLPLAVLINRQSASASEVVAAALQDNNRATVIGERSFGKGTVQSVVRMERGQSAMKLTTAGYLRPSGINIHRYPEFKNEDVWGVSPDTEQVARLTTEQFNAWQKVFTSAADPTGKTADLSQLLAADPQLQLALTWASSRAQTANPAP
ncbi:MAG: S41 family peptidase [Planctomycetota bacterium]